MKLHVIEAGYFKLDGGAMFGVVPRSIWQKSNPPDENNLCNWAMRCLLIEDKDRRILIDTGMGEKQGEKFFAHYAPSGVGLLESLRQKGFQEKDITDVFLTHLHFDHCGGAVTRTGESLVPTFKHATYWTNARHWEAANRPNPREKASFLKENFSVLETSGQLAYVEEGHWINDVSVKFLWGHTDAMMVPSISIGNKILVFCADLLPSHGHIPLPYVMGYDVRPLDTMTEKESFLNEASDQSWILFLEHDPDHECCTVKRTDKGVRFDRLLTLSEALSA